MEKVGREPLLKYVAFTRTIFTTLSHFNFSMTTFSNRMAPGIKKPIWRKLTGKPKIFLDSVGHLMGPLLAILDFQGSGYLVSGVSFHLN